MLEAPVARHHDHETSPSATTGLAPSYARGIELDSRRLLQGQREIVIRHGGERYRLRHTRNDKLILTK